MHSPTHIRKLSAHLRITTWLVALTQLLAPFAPSLQAVQIPSLAPTLLRLSSLMVVTKQPVNADHSIERAANLSRPAVQDVSSLEMFSAQLIPERQDVTVDENRAVLKALLAYSKGTAEDVQPLLNFIVENPTSPWKTSILLNVGTISRLSGRYSRALDAWEQAWKCSRNLSNPAIAPIADRCAGEYLELLSRLGRMDQLSSLLGTMTNSSLRGAASEMLSGAREGLYMMQTKPERSFRCGPLALARVASVLGTTGETDSFCSTTNGTSLAQLNQWSEQIGIKMQVAVRQPGAEVISPAIAHWKAGHFAAVTAHTGDRYLAQDPTFGRELWISKAAIDEESSGYWLVPAGPLPAGWRQASAIEAAGTWGKGVCHHVDLNATRARDKKCRCPKPAKGMAQYDFHALTCSLNITDTPVYFDTPYGPDLDFTLTYNHRDVAQPATIAYSNFGQKWNCGWVAYINEPTSTTLQSSVEYVTPEGGKEVFLYPAGASPAIAVTYQTEFESGLILKREIDPSPTAFSPQLINPATGTAAAYRYVLTYVDGSSEIFSAANNTAASDSTKRVFRTKLLDPQGLGLTFTFSHPAGLGMHLDTVAAPGTVTASIIHIGWDATHPNGTSDRIWKVTFNFANGATKTATLDYDANNRVQKITDAENMSSSFTYASSSDDTIVTMTTPYGTTKFEAGGQDGSDRWLVATDPLKQKERVEYVVDAALAPGAGRTPYPINDTDADVLTSMGLAGVDGAYGRYMNARNSFYWDKRAMSDAGNPDLPPFDKAYVMHWLHAVVGDTASGLLESEKYPNQSRIWYTYRGQDNANAITDTRHYPTLSTGSTATDFAPMSKPYKIGRVVEVNGQPQAQVATITYNQYGKVTAYTDPLNRNTKFTYSSVNNIDLTQIRQTTTGSFTELLASFSYSYAGGNPAVPPHSVAIATDASGKQTKFEYNANAQITKITNPLNEVTRMGYDAITGFLQTLTSPTYAGANNITTFTPDDYLRVWKVTDQDQYTLQFDYDKLDRITRTTYPDATTSETRYDRLDAVLVKERDGRFSGFAYDALGRLRSQINPLGQTTLFDWCTCGGLASMTDARGQTTTWLRDITGRVTDKIYPDNSTVHLDYEPKSGRLNSVRDALGQTTTYTWNVDNTLQGVSYASAVPTPAVTFTYDPRYNRLASMTDGTGTTAYTYYPISTAYLGAGQLRTTDGPLANDTITNNYDALGRLASYSIDGNLRSVTRDSLGRASTYTSSLGIFTYQYDGLTSRLKALVYPSATGLRTDLTYFPSTDLSNRERLQTISNTKSAQVVSKFDYEYYTTTGNAGAIRYWKQQFDTSDITTWELKYDKADQLLNAIIRAGTSKGPDYSTQFDFSYDAGGNRLDEAKTVFGSSTTHRPTAPNLLNQAVSSGGNGVFAVSGGLDVSGTVSVNGQAAQMTGNSFTATVGASPGKNRYQVTTLDANGNRRIYDYVVNSTATGQATLTYDANGNLVRDTSDGVTVTYSWDGVGRLASRESSDGARSEFGYDGIGRRVRQIDYAANGTAKIARYVYVGLELCEERTGDGRSVTKRYFPHGFQTLDSGTATSYFYTRDHLGSVREVADASGNTVARYKYDPFGKRTTTMGTLEADFGFAGMFLHGASKLYLTATRAYNTSLGRWISQDMIGESGGINLYAYVGNNPITRIDPLGLTFLQGLGSAAIGIGIGIGAGVGLAALAGAGIISAPVAAGIIAAGAAIGAAILAANAIGYLTGKDFKTGRKLTSDERSTLGGETLGGALGFGLPKLFAPGKLACFWSGRGGSPGGKPMIRAQNYAKANGGNTLETTPGGRLLQTMPDKAPWPIRKAFWDFGSMLYSAQASGTPVVFLSEPSPVGTWNMIEMPILMNNMRVNWPPVINP